MPRISHEHKEQYKANLRQLLTRAPDVTQLELVEGMKKLGFTLDRFYLSKLVAEIRRERVRRADRQTLNYALASFEDTMSQIVRVAWDIATEPYINPQARVMALREIREAHNDVFEKLFDAGVFNRKLGEIDLTVRNAPLPEEKKKAIREVFEQWGLVEPHKELPPPNGSVSSNPATPAPQIPA